MKKFLLFALAILLFACQNPKSKFIGTWNFIKMEENDKDMLLHNLGTMEFDNEGFGLITVVSLKNDNKDKIRFKWELSRQPTLS